MPMACIWRLHQLSPYCKGGTAATSSSQHQRKAKVTCLGADWNDRTTAARCSSAWDESEKLASTDATLVCPACLQLAQRRA